MSTTLYEEIVRLAPLRYYPLADASDQSGNAQNGTTHGTVTFGQTPLVKASTSKGALFDGSTGYISVPTTGLPTGAAAWSLVCWVKFNSVPGGGNYPAMFGLGTGAGASVTFYYHGDLQQLSLGFTGLTDLFSSIAVTSGHVYFLAGTFNGTTGTFYCYDETAGTSDVTSHAEALSLSYGSSSIGVDASFSLWFGGIAAHAAVFPSALSANRITWLHNVGRGAGGLIRDSHKAPGRIS